MSTGSSGVSFTVPVNPSWSESSECWSDLFKAITEGYRVASIEVPQAHYGQVRHWREYHLLYQMQWLKLAAVVLEMVLGHRLSGASSINPVAMRPHIEDIMCGSIL